MNYKIGDKVLINFDNVTDINNMLPMTTKKCFIVAETSEGFILSPARQELILRFTGNIHLPFEPYMFTADELLPSYTVRELKALEEVSDEAILAYYDLD